MQSSIKRVLAAVALGVVSLVGTLATASEAEACGHSRSYGYSSYGGSRSYAYYTPRPVVYGYVSRGRSYAYRGRMGKRYA
jgi:hypothetical protein